MKTNRDIPLLLKRARTKRANKKRIYAETMLDISTWPEWKKRAALCNYDFGRRE